MQLNQTNRESRQVTLHLLSLEELLSHWKRNNGWTLRNNQPAVPVAGLRYEPANNTPYLLHFTAEATFKGTSKE